jgi:Conserved oligomeric complex COG6
VQAAKLAGCEADRLLGLCGLRDLRDRVQRQHALGAGSSTADIDEAAADDGASESAQEAARASSVEAGTSLAGVSGDEVAGALQRLCDLASAADAIPEYGHISLPRVRTDVARGVARGLAEAYAQVHAALLDPVNGFREVRAAVKAPEQVAALLGVQL